jgi:Tol biopolymer transport system component
LSRLSAIPDGRFVTFASEASNLVPGDNNGVIASFIGTDIFVYDRQERRIERVSVNDAGIEGNGTSNNPTLSADSRFVGFVSSASNLVPGDNNGKDEFSSGDDVFVYDRQERRIERVNVNDAGEEADFSFLFGTTPSLSADGRFVAFECDASNLVPGDDSSGTDIFVYDRQEHRIERVSINDTGEEGNDDSFSPSLSADGRYVAFDSRASNLVQGDNNDTRDIFVYDRQERRIERISVNDEGDEGNGISDSPVLSADGRFITFESEASNLVPGDNNDTRDIFVYDRQERQIERVSVNDAGEEAISFSGSPSLSADGRIVTFESFATDLVPGDTNEFQDVFVVPNPFVPPSNAVNLRVGETIDNIKIPLKPNPGAISGRAFFDTAVLNGVFDLGEEILANHQVFLDSNHNGLFDTDEPRTFSDSEGRYQFDDVPAFRNQVIVVAAPSGFEQIVPEREDQPGFTAFLPAGGSLRGIDFGFRPITTTGQSSDSTISGRVMIDNNRNGFVDQGDEPAVKRVVYMDAGRLGIRDFDDPQVETDKDGFYEFTGLPATVSPLLVLLDETLEQTDPVGSLFDLQTFPLQDIEKREGNPQAVVTGLFNDDTFPDVAVLLAQKNRLSIRLNDGRGGFLPEKFDVELSDFVASQIGTQQPFNLPNSIVTGNFDGIKGLDVAITGNDSNNVLVLRNFDVEQFDPDPAQDKFGFSDVQLIASGKAPRDLVTGQFAGDAATDLVVLNERDEAIRILTNNGSGLFTAGVPIPTGSVIPASIVAADFTRDGKLDLAVTHSVTSSTDFTAGRVTVLVGDGNGGLVLSPNSYTVQADARDSAVGDFNGDKHPDLAVVNFDSQSISILLNQPDGTLRVQTTTLGTTQGAVDIAVADIDNDGDDDILATKLQRREVAIFRNITDRQTGIVRFEPQESIGVGQFTFSERVPFALADLDLDTSGPNGKVTIDIVAVPQDTDTLFVLKNTLVQGSRRAAVSGARTDIAIDVDFLIRPAILPPSFTFESLPQPIIEDAPEQTVAIQGIKKGRESGPALEFSVVSSNTALIASATVTVGTDRANVRYTPLKDANGTAEVIVRAIDAGADATFDTADDGVFEHSFTVTVLAVDDPAPMIQLNSADEIVDMTGIPNDFLANINLIDIRGTGNNKLVLDARKIRSVTPNQTLRVRADEGDTITFDQGWSFVGVETVDARLQRTFQNAGAVVHAIGPLDWTNPIKPSDVNANGRGTAADALAIINALGPRQVIDQSGVLVDPTTIAASLFKFYDPNADRRMTAGDALFVINRIEDDGPESEGEFSPALTGTDEDEHEPLLDELDTTTGSDTSMKISVFGPASETQRPTTTANEPADKPTPLSNELIDAAIEDLFSTPTI